MKFDLPTSGADWWLGEKYDGVRFCWNPIARRAYSRNGKRVLLRSAIKTHLPSSFVEGEVWFGRGNFSYLYTLIAGSLDIVHWQFLRFVFFDMPYRDMEDARFEERYEHLLGCIKGEFNIVAPRVMCTNNDQLSDFVKSIIEKSGEGVILRKQGSVYERGRSPSLLKLKTAQGDKEGIVVAISPTSVTLKIPSGSTFDVPSTDVQISPPSIGDIVTFVYDAQSRRDVPQGPKIVRLRTDIDWDDVVRSSRQEERFLNETSSAAGIIAKQIGNCTRQKKRAD
eukprot:Phypoly_transcript_14393.p1 GENE.Phypoly_transcript_14393~~Phypoly_transcript_14393.p1  ORF type:complete len:318 (+),score=42.03 Phypoly_transcript_14393:113-955(+)